MDKAKDYEKELTYIAQVESMTGRVLRLHMLTYPDEESEERAIVYYFKARVFRGLDRRESAMDSFMVRIS